MARDPAKRPTSAGVLVDELADALRREPVQPTAATTPLDRIAAMQPPARRRLPSWLPLLGLLLVGVAVALVLLLTSGGGGSGVDSASTTPATHHKKSSTKKQTTAKTTPPTASTPAQTQQQTAPPPAPSTQDPVALNNQGKSLIDSGNPQAAIPILQKALNAFPPDQRGSINYAYALFNLGDAYLKSGQPEKAIPLLQARLKFNDQRDTVAAELRQAMQQAGQTGGGPGSGPGRGKHKGRGDGPAGQGD
jgi:tetratricopeptide (TPR) repeat protein